MTEGSSYHEIKSDFERRQCSFHYSRGLLDDGERLFPLLVRVILSGSNYEQKRAACKFVYIVEEDLSMTDFHVDVDISNRQILDPETAAEFYATIEPKTRPEKILDWLKETCIWKRVLSLASKVIHWIGETNGLKWIFQPVFGALLASSAGKICHLL